MSEKRMKSDEARANWRTVLDHVERGGTVVIERWNRPVARIVPMEAPMSTYTVEISASSDSETWQAVTPAETVTDWDGTAQELADWTAGHQNVADGPHWRVQVWGGPADEADLGAKPLAQHNGGDGA